MVIFPHQRHIRFPDIEKKSIKMILINWKFFLRKYFWILPFLSFLIYAILAYIQELYRNEVFVPNYSNVTKEALKDKIQMPAITICSSNQFSYRDADNMLEIPKWYEINYNYTKFMSIFRNFAHHNMDPNEIDDFTQEQKDFLIKHRKAFTELLRKQVTQYCNESQTHTYVLLFRLYLPVMNFCCTAMLTESNEIVQTCSRWDHP